MDYEFPDISYYQGNVNWITMASKTHNIIIRASHGVTPDSQFHINWPDARIAGIRRGVYMFAETKLSPVSQANTLCGLIKNDLPETRVWVDWEKNLDGTFPTIQNIVAIMRQIETNLPSVKVGIYTGYYVVIEHSNPMTHHAEYEYLRTHPLWIPDYDSLPNIPPPWTWPPELHQWGTPAMGLEYGVESKDIDMNKVYNNFQVYDTGNNGEPSMDTINPPQRYRVTASALNIRSVPGGTAASTDIGDMVKDTICTVDGSQMSGTTRWFHLIDAIDPNGNPIVTTDGRKVSERTDCWASGSYLVYLDTPIPPPDPTDPVPPQEVVVTDENGVKWKCVSFTRVQ